MSLLGAQGAWAELQRRAGVSRVGWLLGVPRVSCLACLLACHMIFLRFIGFNSISLIGGCEG